VHRDREQALPLSTALRRQMMLYLLPLMMGPLLMLLVGCFVLPSKWVALHSQNTYLVNLGWGATLHNANCQIVVYGDSTAMVGINPAVIKERTGLNTCNIAEFEGMTILNGTMVLDRYLEQNRKPQFIVFLYAPEDFDPPSQRNMVSTFEAINWRMGQPHKLASLYAIRHHPQYFFEWIEQGWRTVIQRLGTKPAAPKVVDFRADHSGQFPIEAPTQTACEDTVRPTSVPSEEWVSGLRKYNRDDMTVLVDSTPMPPCDPKLTYFRERLSGLIDNEVKTLPIGSFTTDGRLHVNAAGSVLLSNTVANQILQRMSGNSTTGAR